MEGNTLQNTIKLFWYHKDDTMLAEDYLRRSASVPES